MSSIIAVNNNKSFKDVFVKSNNDSTMIREIVNCNILKDRLDEGIGTHVEAILEDKVGDEGGESLSLHMHYFILIVIISQ